MIILNFKTYAESTGENCNKLLNAVQNVAQLKPDLSQHISSAPSILDLVSARKRYRNINIMSQHVDNKPVGSATGWTTPENLAAHEIQFSLYNHSEHRAPAETIIEDIKAIQSRGIKLVVCCENVEEATKLLEAEPFGLAYEPKDLIGSGVSVTTRPEAVEGFIAAVKGKTMVFIGAGVSNAEDITKGMQLGAEGFLLASAFVKAEKPEEKAIELAEAFANAKK